LLHCLADNLYTAGEGAFERLIGKKGIPIRRLRRLGKILGFKMM
jgi:hypothetical protein